MSDAFFKDLNLPEPDIHLGVGSGTHAEQTGQVMIAYEKVLLEHRPEMVIVVGDVNSTIACTLAATKVTYDLPHHSPFTIHHSRGLRPLVAHLEAGLRSFDRTMPEEINRLVTDSLSDILWTPSPDGDENLKREGISEDKIIRVGNIMIDSLEMFREKIEKKAVYKEFGLKKHEYGLITLHRPSNVDEQKKIKTLCKLICRIADKIPLIFPIHPRTRKNLINYGLINVLNGCGNIVLLEPLSYVRFMNLVFNCCLVITDSGGIQEETSYLGIPCLTLRPNTERPVTIIQGTNQLCEISDIVMKVDKILSNNICLGPQIEFWDGKTAARIVESIESRINC
jgi:UDP-N-acetylglucosamine 2-epimerase (non-hydrolysing)